MKTIEKASRALSAGFAGETLGGIAAVVLAIIGLSGRAPLALSAIAGIVVGAAAMWTAGSVLSQFNRIASGLEAAAVTTIEAGAAFLFLGGAAGAILSVLSLLGVHAVVMVAAASVLYGLTLFASGASTYSIDLALPWRETRAADLTPSARAGATGLQALAGCAGIVLGIVSLAGINAMAINLVSMLCIGAALSLTGAVIGARFYRRA